MIKALDQALGLDNPSDATKKDPWPRGRSSTAAFKSTSRWNLKHIIYRTTAAATEQEQQEKEREQPDILYMGKSSLIDSFISLGPAIYAYDVYRRSTPSVCCSNWLRQQEVQKFVNQNAQAAAGNFVAAVGNFSKMLSKGWMEAFIFFGLAGRVLKTSPVELTAYLLDSCFSMAVVAGRRAGCGRQRQHCSGSYGLLGCR